MALQAYTGVHVAVHVAVAYTCTAHVLWLSFELSRHFTELEQVGHYLIMNLFGQHSREESESLRYQGSGPVLSAEICDFKGIAQKSEMLTI